jgi:hypothetical protein
MAPLDLKKILRGLGFDLGNPQESVRVLVELKGDKPSREDLERLTRLGLEVHRVIGRTVLGSSERGRIPALKNDPSVSQVELSVPLKPKHA